MDDMALAQEIETTLRVMNRCWTETWNEPEFQSCIHPRAVAIAPLTPGRLEGQDAYVKGWRDFVEATIIHSWKEEDYRVDVFAGGRCGVATYFFTIEFTMNGIRQTMKGRDMFFLVKQNGHWLVVADQFSPEPAQL
jgi:ketosteroid isomerase-like protein